MNRCIGTDRSGVDCGKYPRFEAGRAGEPIGKVCGRHARRLQQEEKGVAVERKRLRLIPIDGGVPIFPSFGKHYAAQEAFYRERAKAKEGWRMRAMNALGVRQVRAIEREERSRDERKPWLQRVASVAKRAVSWVRGK